MKTFKNYTPHPIALNDGRTFASEGLARVSATFSPFDENGVCAQEFGQVTGLPEPTADTLYIVSALVLTAAKAAGRTDCVAPATGHPDCKRNDKGFIVSVPGFVR
ncbi:MAG: hypothetical protein HXN87_05475 [Prevotella pallens]|uniref:hypothetical protein n=1 Tax=Prevotella pallens TaxID=60133 RepID=UPI001CB0AF5B|nr:hypothetical protein [Prevotella pallens]MBF1519430.1 hypothetical protein [Prevotella pallens]